MNILGVVPLEACLIMAENEENKRIGIAGFYDPVNKVFIRMDGKPVSKEFNKNLEEFLAKKYTK